VDGPRVPGFAKLFDSAKALGKLTGDKMAAAAMNRPTRGSIIRTISRRSELARQSSPAAFCMSGIMALNL
jgi:hypothetical protein